MEHPTGSDEARLVEWVSQVRDMMHEPVRALTALAQTYPEQEYATIRHEALDYVAQALQSLSGTAPAIAQRQLNVAQRVNIAIRGLRFAGQYPTNSRILIKRNDPTLDAALTAFTNASVAAGLMIQQSIDAVPLSDAAGSSRMPYSWPITQGKEDLGRG